MSRRYDLRRSSSTFASIDQPYSFPRTPLGSSSGVMPLVDSNQRAASDSWNILTTPRNRNADVSLLDDGTTKGDLRDSLTRSAIVATCSNVPHSPSQTTVSTGDVSSSSFQDLYGGLGEANAADGAPGGWLSGHACHSVAAGSSHLDLERKHVKLGILPKCKVRRPAPAAFHDAVRRGLIARPLNHRRVLRETLPLVTGRPGHDAPRTAQDGMDPPVWTGAEGITEQEQVGVSALLSLRQFGYPSSFTRVLDGSLDYPPLHGRQVDSSASRSAQHVNSTTLWPTQVPTSSQYVKSVAPQSSQMHVFEQRGQGTLPEPLQELSSGHLEQERSPCEHREDPDVKTHSLTELRDLDIEKKVADGILVHSCPFCGVGWIFPCKETLVRHVRGTHVPEPGCAKWLKEHDECATPEPPQIPLAVEQEKAYRCERCKQAGKQQKFTRMIDLKRHVKSIHFREAHICPFCKKHNELSRRDSLKRHVRLCHPSQVGFIQVTYRNGRLREQSDDDVC